MGKKGMRKFTTGTTGMQGVQLTDQVGVLEQDQPGVCWRTTPACGEYNEFVHLTSAPQAMTSLKFAWRNARSLLLHA